MLPPEIRPSMQGAIPSAICTCSAAGIPNLIYISQVYYVDREHIALSHMFFNKTIRNVRENPHVTIRLTDPHDFRQWEIKGRFDHSETEGAVFDEMEMQIEAIASLSGMTGVFVLKAADIYTVASVSQLKNRRTG